MSVCKLAGAYSESVSSGVKIRDFGWGFEDLKVVSDIHLLGSIYPIARVASIASLFKIRFLV